VEVWGVGMGFSIPSEEGSDLEFCLTSATDALFLSALHLLFISDKNPFTECTAARDGKRCRDNAKNICWFRQILTLAANFEVLLPLLTAT